jgi:transposase
VDTSEQAVVKRVPARRRRLVEEKRRIVEQTLEAGASVARVARAHGVNANQVFAWRRLYHKGLLCAKGAGSMRFLPVAISDVPVSPTVQATGEGACNGCSGTIQVELPKGHLRVKGRVDAEALRAVLEQLLG